MGGSMFRKARNRDFFQVVDGLLHVIRFVAQSSPMMISPTFGVGKNSHKLRHSPYIRCIEEHAYQDSEMDHLLAMTESKDVYNPQTYQFHMD